MCGVKACGVSYTIPIGPTFSLRMRRSQSKRSDGLNVRAAPLMGAAPWAKAGPRVNGLV